MSVRDLASVASADRERVGRKAATLGDLLRAGFTVPAGFVVSADAFDGDGALSADDRAAVSVSAARLGVGAFAVRSSGIAEDAPASSLAGRFLTMLDVRGDDALIDAIRRVHLSARAVDAAGHRADAGGMAVLVQSMLAPVAAGVAFTADPVTGDRETVSVHAVRGLGARLVDGTATPEEWRVVTDRVERRGGAERALDPEQARAVADLARRIASIQGAPQDIEWAIADETIYALQARPMTALPDEVRWVAPQGAFARSFRLGEWIGDPLTPLFESWLLTTLERTMHDDYARLIGQPAPTPLHVVVNGWYYYSLNFLPVSLVAVARMLPGIVVRLPRHGRHLAAILPPLARFGVDLYVEEWRGALLPAYLGAVRRASAEIETAAPARLTALIDELAIYAGRYFTSITFVAGYGWKTEVPLAQFYRRHLSDAIGGHPQLLLRGLVRPSTPPHAVETLDWSFPTHGETTAPESASDIEVRYDRLAAERKELEGRARGALPAKLVVRFDRLLAEAQRACVLREEQVMDFTRAWPEFRRALARLGDTLVATDVIRSRDDIYFLERSELDASLAGDRQDRAALIADRRARWTRQRRLVAPLVIGRLPKMLERLLGAADRALRDPAIAADAAVRGTPASPGRATGRARIVRGANEFAGLLAGEILVCRVTTPSWTPLFARAAAVVTDVGSPSAHASIIAREYGIPAVVGTGDATARIADGDIVTVDGGAGLVWLGRR